MWSTIGSWLLKRDSNSCLSSAQATALEFARLIGLGVAAVILHAATRNQSELAPGHQGLMWIALLLIGRVTSRVRWAGVVSASSAAGTAMLPVWGFGDPFRWLTYFAAGLTLDLGYWALTRWRDTVWLLALLGGLAHATKPLLRVMISQFTGRPYGSLTWGVAYPFLTHFLFGALGAFVGAGVILALRRWTRPKE